MFPPREPTLVVHLDFRAFTRAFRRARLPGPKGGSPAGGPVVDEFHHAAARTYRNLIDHFRPRFLLGLTATPERADGGDIPGLFDDPVRSALLGYLAYNLIYALTGLGLGLLFRGVPSALVVIFLMPLIIETLIVGLTMVPALQWLASAVKFLPFTAGEELMLTSPANFGPAAPDIDFFDRWASGGVFAAFAALIIGAAWIQFKKRDA